MSKRPSYQDRQINVQVARRLLPRFAALAQDWASPAEVERELIDTLEHSAPLYDAYCMAKYLESNHGWASDAELVAMLDYAEMEAYSIREEAIAEWVKVNAIRPKKTIGEMVRVTTPAPDGVRKEFDGEIIGVNEQVATYTVMVSELVHVRTGVGTHGVIVPFEDFHDLAMPPEDSV
jgi:hypothetical protein